MGPFIFSVRKELRDRIKTGIEYIYKIIIIILPGNSSGWPGTVHADKNLFTLFRFRRWEIRAGRRWTLGSCPDRCSHWHRPVTGPVPT